MAIDAIRKKVEHGWSLTIEEQVELLSLYDAAARRRARPGRGGERNPMAKLSAEQVAAIRAAPRYHGVQVDLAARYGVDPKTIRHIRAGKAWKEPTAPAGGAGRQGSDER